MTQQATLARATGGEPRQQRLALVTMSVAQLIFLLDATIVNVALPRIQDSLRFTGSGLEWVVTAYSIAFGGLLLLGGRLGDVVGLRTALSAGLTVFTVASLLGGLAPTPWWLLVCRAAQGAGAAAASPAALSLIAATFEEGAPRTRALGTYTAIASVGSPLGLVAGGVIATYLSWRWVLFVNVPIGALLVAAAPRVFPRTPRHGHRFDVAGALCGTLGLTLLVYALIRAPADASGAGHWTDPAVLASFVLAAGLLAAFVRVEARAAEPLVPLRFFRDRQRSGTYLVLTLISTAMFGVYFFMTLYLQQVWGYSPLRVALVYVPLSLVLMGGARLSSREVRWAGPRRFVVGGLVLAAGGLAWLAAINHSGRLVVGLLLPTLVTYLGFGLTTVPLTSSALAGVAPGESGLASGVFGMVRQVGGATGLAVLGTVAWSAAGSTRAGGAAGTGHALAVGAARGFLVAAVVTALAAAVAATTVRDPR